MSIAKLKTESKSATVTITAPNLQVIKLNIKGTAPLLFNRFSQKASQEMAATQAAGSTARSKKKREAKDFDALYKGSLYYAENGDWNGIPATAFRNAAISACRLVGFKMTLGKLSIFVEADGYDKHDATPLVKITKGQHEKSIMHARNATGVIDLRSRALFREGWEATVTVRYDGDQFTQTDICNLFMRIGQQVGILEGRPDSKQSAGLGFGLFALK